MPYCGRDIMSIPIRALFVLPSFNRSGAVDYIVDLADAMREQGVRVELLALDGKTPAARLPQRDVTVTIAMSGPDEPPRWPRLHRFLTTIRMAWATWNAVRRSDVVMLTWEYGRALSLPSNIAWLSRKPAIAIVQNNLEQSVSDYAGAKNRRLQRRAFERAAAVTCVSHDLVGVLERFGVDARKIVGIPNAINVERIRPLAKAPLPEGVDEDLPFVVGVGRLVAQKGFDYLIEAHAELLERGVDHRLVLVGYGTDKPNLQRLAASLGVADSVRFLGHQDNPYAIMARASVFCLSSRYEGRALTLAEAASLGVPIIASNCPTGPREVLEDGRYGDLVEPNSAKALAEALEHYFRDPTRLKRKSKTAAENADQFSIEHCAERYRELLGKVLS